MTSLVKTWRCLLANGQADVGLGGDIDRYFPEEGISMFDCDQFVKSIFNCFFSKVSVSQVPNLCR